MNVTIAQMPATRTTSAVAPAPSDHNSPPASSAFSPSGWAIRAARRVTPARAERRSEHR